MIPYNRLNYMMNLPNTTTMERTRRRRKHEKTTDIKRKSALQNTYRASAVYAKYLKTAELSEEGIIETIPVSFQKCSTVHPVTVLQKSRMSFKQSPKNGTM